MNVEITDHSANLIVNLCITQELFDTSACIDTSRSLLSAENYTGSLTDSDAA